MPRADAPEVLELDIEAECCHVVDVGCEAPAGWINGGEITEGEAVAEFICDECWEHVCGSCSRALADGRRVCVDCAEGERIADEERPELPPAASGGRKVFSKMCGTCIFGPKSPVRPGRLRDLQGQWQSKDIHQTCHLAGVAASDDDDDGPTTQLDGEDIVCHGFFREVFMRHGTGQNLRISERLGGFEYIDPDEYKKAHPAMTKLTRKRKTTVRPFTCFDARGGQYVNHRYQSPSDGTCLRCGTLRPYRGIRR